MEQESVFSNRTIEYLYSRVDDESSLWKYLLFSSYEKTINIGYIFNPMKAITIFNSNKIREKFNLPFINKTYTFNIKLDSNRRNILGSFLGVNYSNRDNIYISDVFEYFNLDRFNNPSLRSSKDIEFLEGINYINDFKDSIGYTHIKFKSIYDEYRVTRNINVFNFFELNCLRVGFESYIRLITKSKLPIYKDEILFLIKKIDNNKIANRMTDNFNKWSNLINDIRS